MKTIYHIFRVCGIGLLLTGLASCDDDNGVTQSTGCSGVPQLTSITTTTDLKTSISSCNLGDWIVLHGQNLCAAESIIVNGVSVNMREVFLEPSKATLQVPRQLAESGPTNRIEVVGESNSTKLDVTIDIPELILTGLTHEFAAAGETVNINGANFDLYEITGEKGKVYFGTTAAEITATTEKYITVVVPAGAKENDIVRVTGEKSDKTAPGRYRDTRGIFESFEGGFGWAGTDGMVTDGTKPGDVKACHGKYLRIAKQFGDWDWFPFIANVYTWPEEVFSNPELYCLKFEVATLASIAKKFINFDQTNYQWRPWEASEFTTYGKWITITLEMKDVLNGTSNYPGGNFLFQLAIQGPGPEYLDLCIDNYRIMKKE